MARFMHGSHYLYQKKYNVSIAAEGGVSAAPDMSSIFQDCTSLKTIDFGGFDTSKVTNMSDMFCSCEALTSIDIRSFDTSSVTDMSRMFYFCEALTSIDLRQL